VFVRILHERPQDLFTGYDLIWCIIAMLRPFQTFKSLNLRIRGPFNLSAGPIQALQFDRAQPIPQPIAPSAGPSSGIPPTRPGV
jgi:hypothetical protein